jgi:DNA-binding transcriptional LysR family regulator
MITLHAIQIFIRVAREGSFSAAARSLGLSPASVARQVSALEQAIGAPLIYRNSRTLSLTEAGRRYLERVRPLVDGLHEAQEAISGFNTRAEGSLRVHCRTTVGTLTIAPALPRFLALNPEIEVTLLLSNDRTVDLIGDNIDIDIQVGAQADSSHKARLLARDGSVLCAAPAYLDRAGPVLQPKDLSRHNCLVYHYSDHAGQAAWQFTDPAGVRQNVPVQGAIRTDNGVVLQSALHDGVGIAVVPEWSVKRQIAEGALVALLPEYRVRQSDAGTAVYAVFPASRQEAVKVRMFIDFLIELFR